MREDYLINIEGVMEMAGDVDTVNLMTRGDFVQQDGSFSISYKEQEGSGYEGNITTVKVENEDKVSMIRQGTMSSELVIERGRRHVCHYDTGYGALSFGVAADEIENLLTEVGGELSFSYTLDSDKAHFSRNQVKITVSK